MSKVIFILIDAFRSSYLSSKNTPFLKDYSANNLLIKTVTQSRSYCERAEIFTGKTCKELGLFTAIGFDPSHSPFKNLKFIKLIKFIEFIFKDFNFYYRLRNKIIKKIFSKNKFFMSAYRLPYEMLCYFSLTEDLFDFTDLKALSGHNNLYHYCSKNNIRFTQKCFTSLKDTFSLTDNQRLAKAKQLIKENDFIPLYISCLDSVGHRYGPDSEELCECLRHIDSKLKNLFNEIKSNHSDTNFIFLGDHGMSKVKQIIDLSKIIKHIKKKLNFKTGVDFIYFIDSTIFRVWYFNENAKKEISKFLLTCNILTKSGNFVNHSNNEKFQIPINDRKYGDTLWVGNLGVLLFPDFFHTKVPYKGMHGYDVNHSSSQGICIATSNHINIINNYHLSDIFKIIVDRLRN